MTVHILGGMDTLRAGQARDSQLQGATKGGRKKAEWRKAAAALSLSFLPFFLRPRAGEGATAL